MSAFGYSIEPIDKDSVILHFETEQSEYDWHKRLKYVVKGDVDPERFISYALTKFAPKDRLGHILNIAYYHLTKGVKIHLMAIDGIADLVDSVNDEAECNILVHKAHSIATTYKIPVLVILHLNPDGSKSRGRLGSQLDRKAESVLIVERDKDAPFSCIKARYTRNADLFQLPIETFHWDDLKKRHVHSGQLGEEQKFIAQAEMLIDFVTEVFNKENLKMPKAEFMKNLGDYFQLQKSQQYKYLEKISALGYVDEVNRVLTISDSIKGQL
jgi:hypothetical protein